MVTFELVSGGTRNLRPDSSGRMTFDADQKFIFPTHWLNYQINANNVGIDDPKLFVKDISKSMFGLIEILSNLDKYKEFDYVVGSTEKGNNTIIGYMIPEDRGVYPTVNKGKKQLSCLEKLRLDVHGSQIRTPKAGSVYQFNQSMEGYFLMYGVVLRRYECDPKSPMFTRNPRKVYKLDQCIQAWIAEDLKRMADRKANEALQKRKKRIESQRIEYVKLPSWMTSSFEEMGKSSSTSFL